MRKVLLITLFLAVLGTTVTYAQSVYNPNLHTATNKPLGLQGKPADARSYFYNTETFTYRPYNDTTEVRTYLPVSSRAGNFPIFVKQDSKVTVWMYKDSTLDDDLVQVDKQTDSSSTGTNGVKITLSGTNRIFEVDSSKYSTLNALKDSLEHKIISDTTTSGSLYDIKSGLGIGIDNGESTILNGDVKVSLDTVGVNGAAVKSWVLSQISDSTKALIVNHIAAQSGTPTLSIGTSFTGTPTISGTDVAGYISLNLSYSSGADSMDAVITVTFNQEYSSSPYVIISPASPFAASTLYVKEVTTSSFIIGITKDLTASATPTDFSFYYHVIQ